MRAFNRTDDDDEEESNDDDDDDAPSYPVEVIPISKELTFNEKVVMWVVLMGIIFVCAKEAFCPEYALIPGFCPRLVREPDDVEREFHFKVRQKKLGFDVNVSDDEGGGQDEETQVMEDEDEIQDHLILNDEKTDVTLIYNEIAFAKNQSKKHAPQKHVGFEDDSPNTLA